MTTPEGKIKDKVKAYLDSIGAYYFMPVQTGYGKRTLDFLCCICGAFIAIEAKRPGAKAKPFQTRVADEIGKAGGNTWVITNDEELQKFGEFVATYIM